MGYSLLSEAVTDVRQILNEATAAFWSDTEIEDWIKEGVVVACSKGLIYEASVDITLVASQLEYAATDVLEVNHAFYKTSTSSAGNFKGLIKISPMQIGNLLKSAAGRPKYYALWNRVIFVWPLPTSAEVTEVGEIQLLCSKETDDITALQDEYQHLGVVWACARAKQKDSKFAEANNFFQQFYSDAAFEREDKINREVDYYDDFRVKPIRPQGGRPGAQR